MILLTTVEQEGKLKLVLFSWDYGLKSTTKTYFILLYKYEHEVSHIFLLAKSGFDTLIKPKYNKALLKKKNDVFYI